jgi:hypothetical protein
VEVICDDACIGNVRNASDHFFIRVREKARMRDGELQESAAPQDSPCFAQRRLGSRHIHQAHEGRRKIELLGRKRQILPVPDQD